MKQYTRRQRRRRHPKNVSGGTIPQLQPGTVFTRQIIDCDYDDDIQSQCNELCKVVAYDSRTLTYDIVSLSPEKSRRSCDVTLNLTQGKIVGSVENGKKFEVVVVNANHSSQQSPNYPREQNNNNSSQPPENELNFDFEPLPSINFSKAELQKAKPTLQRLKLISQQHEEDDDDENDKKNNESIQLLIEKTPINEEDVKKVLASCHTMVPFTKYKEYIDAVFEFIKNNSSFSEGIGRIAKGKWDFFAAQKSIGRTDNQIKNDMVREIIISKVVVDLITGTQTLDFNADDMKTQYVKTMGALGYPNPDMSSLKTVGVMGSTSILGVGVGGYGGLIGKVHAYLDVIKADTMGLSSKLENLMFFIPRTLPKKIDKFTGVDYNMVLNADNTNKINLNTVYWPKFILVIIVYFLTKTKVIMESRGKINIIFYRYIVFNIKRFERILLAKDQHKCIRITDMLNGKNTSLLGQSYDIRYNALGEEIRNDKELMYGECGKKFHWNVPGLLLRCRRLVDARVNLNAKFDKTCARKKVGGRRTRRKKKRIDGGNAGEEFSFAFFMFVTGVILGGVGIGLGNGGLVFVGALFIFIALMIFCNFCIFLM
jgi:hypothetical protein